MLIQKAVSTIEVSDETLMIQIYQTLDETLAETSDLNVLKAYAKLMGEAIQKALTLPYFTNTPQSQNALNN